MGGTGHQKSPRRYCGFTEDIRRFREPVRREEIEPYEPDSRDKAESGEEADFR